MNSLNNKVTLVTRATPGIGVESVKILAETGASVLVAGRNRLRKQEDIVPSIQSNGGKGEFLGMFN